jgi:hypothetical protein
LFASFTAGKTPQNAFLIAVGIGLYLYQTGLFRRRQTPGNAAPQAPAVDAVRLAELQQIAAQLELRRQRRQQQHQQQGDDNHSEDAKSANDTTDDASNGHSAHQDIKSPSADSNEVHSDAASPATNTPMLDLNDPELTAEELQHAAMAALHAAAHEHGLENIASMSHRVIPSAGLGLWVHNVERFVVGFFASLMPSWQPPEILYMQPVEL